jgi:hypothetical protein
MTTTSTKNKIECSEKIKVNIPQKIWSDIHYLHAKYKEEYSGYIYFRPEGSIEDPDNLILNVEEFVLMDLGTAAFTEIDPTGEQVVEMFDKRPQLMELKQGLLHTHNNMKVFFSGTDWDTLLEKAQDYPYFLSVIVNIQGDCIAKVSLHGFKEGNVKYSYKFKKGYVEKVAVVEKVEVIYTYDCIINIQNDVDEEFNKLTQAKIAKEEAKQLSLNLNYNTSYQPNYKWQVSQNQQSFNKSLNKYDTYNGKKRDLKGKSADFLISLIMQDEDCVECELLTLSQAKDSWNEEIGMSVIEQYKEYIEAIAEDVFYKIFGENTTPTELFEIRNHIQIMMGEHPSEVAIKDIIKDTIDVIKQEITEEWK